MILTGVAPLDNALGGLLEHRIHVVTGGPGSAKTALALRFLWTGLGLGETGLVVTLGSGRDLKALAAHLGMDLDRHVRAGRLVLLRYRDEFTSRPSYSGQPSFALSHLDRLIDGLAPKRIVVDTVTPFLADGTASGEGIAQLARWLDRTGATSIVTYGGSTSGDHDPRLEPLLQRAACIVNLERSARDRLVADVVTARYATRESEARLTLSDIALDTAAVAVTAPPVQPRSVRDVLYAHTAAVPSEELLALVRGSRLTGDVTRRRAASAQRPPSVRDFGGIVVETDRRSVPLTLQLVPAIAEREPVGAIVVVARTSLRSLDRAQLLDHGADDVLTNDMSTAELLARFERALERGHQARDLEIVRDATPALQRGITKGQLRALQASELAQALERATSERGARPGALLGVRLTHDDDQESLNELSAVVLRVARIESGDLVALVGGTIVVHLHGTRVADAGAFLERVRARWSVVGRGTIRGEPLSRVTDVAFVAPPTPSSSVPSFLQ
jgi:KaiC/GvpD/RAD55 family RecA-like ATPase